MVRQFYEMRVLHGVTEVSKAAFSAVLDFDDPDSTTELLTRHLIGAALRAGATEDRIHEYAIEIYDRTSTSRDQMVTRWALPYGGEVA